MFFKNKFFYIFGFATFNLVSINNLSSEDIKINHSIKNSSKIERNIFLNSDLVQTTLENVLSIFQNNFLKFLANNPENKEIKENEENEENKEIKEKEENKDIEIVSDIQFEKDNIFMLKEKLLCIFLTLN